MSGRFHRHKVKEVGVEWLVFLYIGALDLIGRWLGDGRRANFIKKHVLREIGLLLRRLTTYSKLNTGIQLGGSMYLVKKSTRWDVALS